MSAADPSLTVVPLEKIHCKRILVTECDPLDLGLYIQHNFS